MTYMYRYKVSKGKSVRGMETGSITRARQILEKKGFLYSIYVKEPKGEWKSYSKGFLGLF